MRLNTKPGDNWLEELFGDSPYSLDKRLKEINNGNNGSFSVFMDTNEKYGKNWKSNPEARQHSQEKIRQELRVFKEKINNSWESRVFNLSNNGEKIQVYLPSSLGGLIESYWDFIKQSPSFIDILKNPEKYGAHEVGEIIMRLPIDSPEVKRFQFSCMKFGFVQKLIDEVVDTPHFGENAHLSRFYGGARNSYNLERNSTGEEALIYTNGVENIGKAFLERFGTIQQTGYGTEWEKDSSFYINGALSGPYTKIQDIEGIQKLFESFSGLNTPEVLELLSQVEKGIENTRMLLYPADLSGAGFECYEGLSIFNLYHKGIINYSPRLDFYAEDEEGINKYLEDEYGEELDCKSVLEDGLKKLEEAHVLLNSFFTKIGDMDSPVLQDFKNEVDTFFKYYNHKFFFRGRDWKNEKVVVHYDSEWYGGNQLPYYIAELESFQHNFRSFKSLFDFLGLVQNEGWSKIELNQNKPTQYTNGWHLKHPKSEQTPASMSHDGSIKIFSGANASGKSFGGLKRDAYIRMAMQAFGYAPCESGNLGKPASSILLLDRPSPEKIKEQHFSHESVKHCGEASAFMQEARSISDSLKYLGHNAAVYLDEVFTTTSPEDQAALLLGLIEYIRERNGDTMLATHNEYIIEYFKNAPPEAAQMLHFGTQQGRWGEENTYQIESGSADSNFLDVCRRCNAPSGLIDFAEAYLDGTFTMQDAPVIKKGPLNKYSSEQRETLKKTSVSIMQLFHEAGAGSILKYYSQDNDLQSWLNFERGNLSSGFVDIGLRSEQHSSIGLDIFHDARYYSLLTKLFLYTHTLTSEEVFERQQIFSQLQKIPQKQYETIAEVLEFLGSFDTCLETLDDINKNTGLNKYISGFVNKRDASFTPPKGNQHILKFDFGSNKLDFCIDLQDCIDLNNNLLGDNAPDSLEPQSSVDIFRKLCSYRSINISKGYDEKNGQYKRISGNALRHILEIIPTKFVPEDTSVERNEKRTNHLESIKDKLIKQGFFTEDTRPSDEELKKYLKTETFISHDDIDKVFCEIVPENISYEIIANFMVDLEKKTWSYIDSLPTVSWKDIVSSKNTVVQEIMKRKQISGKKEYEGNFGPKYNNKILKLDMAPSEHTPWSSLYYILEFPQALKMLEEKLNGVDSVYISQSLGFLKDIAQQVQDGSFHYNSYSPSTPKQGTNYSTLSRLGQVKKSRQAYYDIDSNRGKSKGQVRMEILGLKSILYWSEVIKSLGFGKASFTANNTLKFQKLSHMCLAGKGTIPNDVNISQDGEQVRVLTGPNGSGKTFHEQSIILGIMSGLSTGYTPAESALIPIFDRVVYLDRVVENSSEGLSAGANEIQYWKEIWDDIEGAKNTFVGFDELFSTTSPEYQEACTISVLNHLKQQGVLGVLSTHNHDAINALTPYNDTLVPYYFEYGNNKSGEIVYNRNITKGHAPSEGIEVAKRMGINPEIIEKAKKYRKLI